MKIGVLALQGAFAEHKTLLEQTGRVSEVILVRKSEELIGLDGLIIPGGESTAIGRLLRSFSLQEPLKEAIEKGLPTWGTCAGLILLAKSIWGGEQSHLNLLDVEVTRNAFGRQLESFDHFDVIPEFGTEPVHMRFIRAPLVTKWEPSKVRILYEVEGQPVAVLQDNILGTSFHPELTASTIVHNYFLDMIQAI